MAINIMSLSELDVLFADFVQTVLGLKQEQVLISFSEKGQKSSVFTNDVCYVHTYIEDDNIQVFKNRTKEYKGGINKFGITQRAMRRVDLQVAFYGPNSDVFCTTLNEFCYLEDAKQFFYNNDLSLIPDATNHPIKTHELINGRWWDRSDIRIKFYNTVTVSNEVSPITSTNIKTIRV